MRNNPFNFFDNVLCISLKSSNDRRDHIFREFRKVGIEQFQFIDAINKDDIEVLHAYENNQVTIYPPCFRCGKKVCQCENNILIPAQVANFLSHKRAWQEIIDKKHSLTLIVEDDVFFTDYHRKVLRRLESDNLIKKQFDVENSELLLRLGWAKCDDHFDINNIQVIPGLLKMSNPCYAINYKMALKLITNFHNINTTSDIYIHDIIGKKVNNYTISSDCI